MDQEDPATHHRNRKEPKGKPSQSKSTKHRKGTGHAASTRQSPPSTSLTVSLPHQPSTSHSTHQTHTSPSTEERTPHSHSIRVLSVSYREVIPSRTDRRKGKLRRTVTYTSRDHRTMLVYPSPYRSSQQQSLQPPAADARRHIHRREATALVRGISIERQQ